MSFDMKKLRYKILTVIVSKMSLHSGTTATFSVSGKEKGDREIKFMYLNFRLLRSYVQVLASANKTLLLYLSSSNI